MLSWLFERGIDMDEASKRNPTWTRDELILALDFYVQCQGNPPAKDSVEIRALSVLLNELDSDITKASEKFRNVNGVYMKIMNFRRFDPKYAAKGAVGLSRGGKGDEYVWMEFTNKPDILKATAASIRANVKDLNQTSFGTYEDIDIAEAEEGRVLTRVHLIRERNRDLVKKKKFDVVKRLGTLCCEVCCFDFQKKYGERGSGFAEVHHIKPLHTLQSGSKTTLDDLSILCANCHRMIHAKSPWLEIDELKKLLQD
jgi:5-methylcytosine-specific restriction protein A